MKKKREKHVTFVLIRPESTLDLTVDTYLMYLKAGK